jgi:hypothetical protein
MMKKQKEEEEGADAS